MFEIEENTLDELPYSITCLQFACLAYEAAPENVNSMRHLECSMDDTYEAAESALACYCDLTASCLSNGALYLCAPGVNAIKYLPSAIRSLSVERLLGEYDMDQIRQEQYSAALRRMQDTLKPLGIPYIQQMWNPAYNGIDDYKLHSRWLPLAA